VQVARLVSGVRYPDWVLLTLLLACTPPEPLEADLFRQALTAPSLELALSLCIQLPLPTSEDCTVAARESHGATDPTDCATLVNSRWRSECFFVTAEAQVFDGDPTGGLASCAQSGHYRQSCIQHLWQQELFPLGQLSATQALAPMAELTARYGPYLVDGERQLWREYWMQYAERRPINPMTCAELPSQAHCEDGWRVATSRRLWQQLKPYASKLESGPQCMAMLPHLRVGADIHPDAPELARQYSCKTQTGKLPWTPIFTTPSLR